MKKILVLGIVLALVLSLVLPTAAMAKPPQKDFNAEGVMTSIDVGDVRPLGNSGLWKVRNRHIEGTFLEGDLGTAGFVITYGGVFNILDQSGQMKGDLVTDLGTFKINGTVEPMKFVQPLIVEGQVLYLCNIEISGRWNGKGANGYFEASLDVLVDPVEGHVVGVQPTSSFVMTGKYHKK